MSEAGSSNKPSAYPYLSANQWQAIRAKLRQSLPKGAVELDWVISALGSTEKTAKNVLPQLRTLALIDEAGKLNDDLVHDLRDDSTYATAVTKVVETVYPTSLRDSHGDADEDLAQVAGWFMRNAKTGEATARLQAKFYLHLISGKTTPEAAASSPKTADKRPSGGTRATTGRAPTAKTKVPLVPATASSDAGAQGFSGPALHIDLQIHISSDASDEQIELVFSSIAKHLYGRG